MAQEKKDDRIVLRGDEVRLKLLEGAQAAYDAVTSTYGPKGRNVLIEKPFGRPILTRDGVTVSRDVYFADRAKNVGAQSVMEASETTNRIAGDGTTATVALSYHLLQEGSQAIDAGLHPMELKETYLRDREIILEHLTGLTKQPKKGQLQQVATVSSGDSLLGQLIAEAVEYVGADGGIITEKEYVADVEREYVDGYYLQKGFEAIQTGKKELANPFVLVSIKKISSVADAAEILTKLVEAVGITPQELQAGNIPRILIVGNIDGDAYNTIVNNINRGQIDAVLIKTPPAFGDMGKQLLEDIAIYAGCEAVTDTTNMKEFNRRYVGTINRVVASKSESTLFNEPSESIQARINEIREQLKEERVDAIAERLRDRAAKLEGKVAIFRIGGATDTEKEEKEFRVEDAILATRAAALHGVVPGGGVTLLELSKLDISSPYQNALQNTFKQLLINANLDAEIKLEEALKAPSGQGYNLRESDRLVDVVKEGILDPSLVVEEIVKNATAVAANVLTTDTLIIFTDKEEK